MNWHRWAYGGAIALLAMRAEAQDAPSPRDSTRARVSGFVYDSIGRHPVAGAMVQLARVADPSRALVTTSASDGSFRFDSVATGTWVAGFFARELDEYALDGPLTRIDVRESGNIRLMLAIASPRTIVARSCGANASRDSTGLFIGYLRSASGGAVANGHVQVRWQELVVEKGGISRTTPTVEATTTSTGAFAMCGVPTAGAISVRGWSERDSSGIAELEMPATGFMRRDLVIGTSRLVTVAVRDSAAGDSARGDSAATARVFRGDGRLRGSVVRPNGTPVEGARLMVWGTGQEATSNGNGTFAFRDLPTGTWTLEARAIAHFPVRMAIDLLADSEVVAVVKMDLMKTVLDTVKVVASRTYLSRSLQEFDSRRKGGFGHFLGPDEIERQNPIYVSDLFRMIPGVYVMPSGNFGRAVVMRARTIMAGYCVPAFFIDGMRVMVDAGELEQVVSASDVLAVEVYSRASNVPPLFNTMNGCGSIVVHTGARTSSRAKR